MPAKKSILALVAAAVGLLSAGGLILFVSTPGSSSLATASTTPTTGPPSTMYKLCVYTTSGASGSSSSSSAFNYGHAFVRLTTNTGSGWGAGTVYGKYPDGNWVFNTDGTIVDDGELVWSWSICYSLTQAQYNAAMKYGSKQSLSPSAYKLLSANCVSFAVDLAGAAGQTVPGCINGAGIPSPGALYNSLSGVGNGGSLDGGTVHQNTGGVTANGDPDPPTDESPPCCDLYPEITENPAETAASLDDEYNDNTGLTGYLSSDLTYKVEIKDAAKKKNLWVVEWGDGTTSVSFKSPDFSHSYASAPSSSGYDVQVFDVGNAEVTEWDTTVYAPNGSKADAEVDTDPPVPAQTSFGSRIGVHVVG